MNHIFLKTQLREVVQHLKTCQSLKDEKRYIAKECADIRDNFCNGSQQSQCVGMTKLLYFYVLGYPAHYGQMECLKLVSSTRFVDKRIGYLGCMLLLDENADIHLLLTNSLLFDLNSTTEAHQSLALCTLACICSVDMARALSNTVESLIHRCSNLIKKKAVLCANRLIIKCNDLVDTFINVIPNLFTHKDPSIILVACTITYNMLVIDPTKLEYFQQKNVNQYLIDYLNDLVVYGSTACYSSHDVANPFLKVKILRLLSKTAVKDSLTISKLNNLFEKIFDEYKDKGLTATTVIYEACRTVFCLETSDLIWTMTLERLGVLIESTDPLKAYIGLRLLIEMGPSKTDIVKRYRNKIFYCLNNCEITVQRRCLEFLFLTLNNENVQESLDRLVQFLFVCDVSISEYLATSIHSSLEKFKCETKFYITVFCDLLETAPNYLKNKSLLSFIDTISQYQNYQAYVVERMIRALKSRKNKPILINLASWIIGEYGQLLRTSQLPNSASKLLEIIREFKFILDSPDFQSETKHITLTSLLKVATQNPSCQESVTEYVSKFTNCMDVELQQRSLEWKAIVNNYNYLIDVYDRGCDSKAPSLPQHVQKIAALDQKLDSSNLIDFEALFSQTSESKEISNNIISTPTTTNNNISTVDDLLLLDFNSFSGTPTPKIEQRYDLYDKNGVVIFVTYPAKSSRTKIEMKFHVFNKSKLYVTDFTCQLNLTPNITASQFKWSSPHLTPSQASELATPVTINNPSGMNLEFPVTISYKINGAEHKDSVFFIQITD